MLGLALALVALSGCDVPLPGADDVELTLEVPAGGPADLGPRLERRLAAAGVGADVTCEPERCRVVVAAAHAEDARALATFPGGLTLFEQTGELEADLPALRALARAHDAPDDERLLLAEQAAPGAPKGLRVRESSRIVLREGLLVGVEAPAQLRLRGRPGSPAAAALAELAKAPPRPRVAAIGDRALGPARSEPGEAPVVVLGTTPAARERALAVRALATSPLLPPLREAGVRRLPVRPFPALACVLLPFLCALASLGLVRRFDRAHPEPRWLVGATFALGAAASPLAGAVEAALVRALPELDPTTLASPTSARDAIVAWLAFAVVAGVPEETAKRLAAALALRRPEFDEPVDGLVYAAAAALGFAAFENLRYFAAGRLDVPLVVARTFVSLPAHAFLSAAWGYAAGMRLEGRGLPAPYAVGLAAAAHGLVDALVLADPTGLAVALAVTALAATFVALLRRSLRFGVVRADAGDRGTRRVFPTGRPGLFAAAAAAVPAAALALVLVARALWDGRHAVSPFFPLASAALLLALLGAAWLAARELPLDAVVDARGVAFGGTERAFHELEDVRVRGAFVVVRARGRDELAASELRVGPARRDVRDALARAIKESRPAPPRT